MLENFWVRKLANSTPSTTQKDGPVQEEGRGSPVTFPLSPLLVLIPRNLWLKGLSPSTGRVREEGLPKPNRCLMENPMELAAGQGLE